ncbi:patatin-like phospholipase [Kordia sp. SMS9]|uniref:patatin-like phospholipase family protein n=1 Tax=Kordia sp. SMS9 TaxID=2282170 RepID=UPI000E0D3279|nr:patatin-like phospholipase family protein [Kordia sp. SMS9]AXG71831.1 patatin-like phospholipase [Kordia sp. SMS9]
MSTTKADQLGSVEQSEQKNTPKFHVILFIILTLLMIVCGKMFHIYDWIAHPQFTEEGVKSSWFFKHTSLYQEIIFIAFFIFDFVWAFLLFYITGKYIHKKATEHNVKIIFKIFLVLASLAYTFDCTENFYYLWNKEYPKTIVSIKIGFYSVTFLLVLLTWIRFSLRDRLVLLKEFMYSSWISLLFLFIIGLTLPKAPQLNSIIVDLYYHPFWFVFVLLLGFAPIYCIVLSHYPNYFLLSKSNRKFQDKDWKMYRIFSIFGIVWYKNKAGNSTPESVAYESELSFLRRVIGVFFYAAIFYMIAYTADTNFGFGVELSGFVPLLLVSLIVWLYVLKKQKDKWRLYYANGLREANESARDLYFAGEEGKKLNNPIRTYVIFVIVTILAHFALFILLFWFTYPFNYTTVILSLLCISLQAITYTYYRTFRTLFKYAFFDADNEAVINSFPLMNDENDPRTRAEKKQAIISMFEGNNYFGQTPFFKKLATLRIKNFSLGAVSNSIIFLKVISYFGAANLLFFLAINFVPQVALHINGIIIIVSAFFLLYGIIVIILKHFMYYNLSEDDFAKTQKSNFRFTVYGVLLAMILLNYLSRHNESTANNLFELAKIEETITPETINLEKYIQNLPNKRYYIGCYGGGMKANAWTMTVLNALDKDGTLYDKTVCLSGASGGTIGLINYSAIKHQNDDAQFRDSIIRKIGTENILSMDLAHLLGRDWFTHMFLPINLIGKDRSTAAMYTYAKYVNHELTQKEFDSTSYRQFWYNMYKRKERFPILISNTTNIKGRQGMAVSIPVKNNHAKAALYLGANDILELGNNQTLSFYNAASTTNRFPLISPAATIEGEGQYNDGGIYENSGLLSAYKLYEAINELDANAKNKETVFINIINDKSAYVKSVMDAVMEDCNGGVINKSNEFSAILNSVAATEMFPGYIKDKLNFLAAKHDNFTFENIYLPHKFDLDDVRAIYGQKIKDTACVVEIAKIIQENNDDIWDLMKGGSKETFTIIEPEMSRVMAIPAFNFMQYMLKHERVEKVLNMLH